MGDKLYTAAELAKLFGKSRQTIYNWIDAGRFPNSFEVGEGNGTITLIPASDVESVRMEEVAKLEKKLAKLNFQAVTA